MSPAEPATDAEESALDLWPAAGPDGVPSLGEVGLDHFAPYLLNRISNGWNASLADALNRFDISTTKMRTLAVLSVSPGITIKELSVLAVTEQSTLSRTLDGLEQQGLIRRQPKPDDARVREVFITEAGQAVFAALWPVMFAMYGRLFRGVDPAEFRAFLGTAHKILRNIQAPEG
jgi:DNA-binding MarR family transcriptional regulator